MGDKKYYIRLYYGYEECESGIYHSFRAEDDKDGAAVAEIAEGIAEALDCKVTDDCFNWNVMDIPVPEDVVRKISEDAVMEYIRRNIR